jgi:hypothetical protein
MYQQKPKEKEENDFNPTKFKIIDGTLKKPNIFASEYNKCSISRKIQTTLSYPSVMGWQDLLPRS